MKRKKTAVHLVGVDAFDERTRPVRGAHRRAQNAVDVDVVEGDVTRIDRRALRMIPADQDRLVELALQSQLARRRD